MRRRAVLFGILMALTLPTMAQPPLSGSAAELYRQARQRPRYQQAAQLRPTLWPTPDGRTFSLVWKASPRPTHWIVSLHGSHGFATEDLAVWAPHLAGRDVGIVCLQWWLGTGDSTADYLTPREIYAAVSPLLTGLGARPGQVMLEGFSRAATNTYAVAAIDAGQGERWFGLCVAQSGGVAEQYPPTMAIDRGDYGVAPLKTTRWVTVAGAADPNPERDGIPAMRRTAAWLEAHGAQVLARIEDAREGHGAMHRSVANTAKVLDLFLAR